jgi:RNA polymerase sigma factor (sigma-70 family)
MSISPQRNTSWLLRKLEEKNAIVATSREEELRLGTVIQNPKSTEAERNKAIEQLVVRNLYLVFKLSHKYKRNEFDFEDIVSYGIIGLFNAAKRYDPTRGYKFATYAYHWIKESIMKAIRECSGVPKVPAYLIKNLWRMTKLMSTIPQDQLESDVSVSDKIGINVEDARYFKSLSFKTVSFDSNHDPIDYNTPEIMYYTMERKGRINSVLRALLTEQEFLIVAHTTGLDGFEILKTKQIGLKYSIKNIKRVKRNAYRKMSESPLLKQLYKELKD